MKLGEDYIYQLSNYYKADVSIVGMKTNTNRSVIESCGIGN